ncbi:hypothetical protein O7599_12885 [Streptomyces sp. WMMC500]|uniref:hypothetical protein n=1 Tax=Streptomyces sp. WMMC500 TaxID=3015154 RepID=UPI00248CF8AB|nr:hypothetical protein [Streptomyces sp. WMMC500]WBB63358.1 hypothetical protein O7599_12885 [Streptomyces sp. WMMC500]
MRGRIRAVGGFPGGRLPAVAGIAGLLVGAAATWLVVDSGADGPDPVVDYADADEDLVRTAADAWRAEPANDRPRGGISVVHSARAGDRDVVVLLDETGLGSAYARSAEGGGQVEWVTPIGSAADGEEPARVAARSLLVGPSEIWVGGDLPRAGLEAAVLAGDGLRWRPVDVEDGVARGVPEAAPDGCGLRVVADRGRGLVHVVRSGSSPVGAVLQGDVRPLDAAGRRPPEDRPRVGERELDAAQLRLLSRLACVDKSETREPLTGLWYVSELWRGDLPAGGGGSLLTLGTGEENLLLLASDNDDDGGFVLGRDVPGTLWSSAAVASWYDRTDPAEEGPYRHWIVVAGTQEVERIEVVLGDGRRVAGRGRFLAVDLEKYGIDGSTTSYEVAAVDGDGDPVRVLR